MTELVIVAVIAVLVVGAVAGLVVWRLLDALTSARQQHAEEMAEMRRFILARTLPELDRPNVQQIQADAMQSELAKLVLNEGNDRVVDADRME